MAKVAPVFLLMALLIGEPAQAQDTSPPFAGVFANAEITMTLRKHGAGYTGQVQFDGQSYAVAAQEAGTILQGTYAYNGQAIPFQATLQGKTMTLASEGVMYTLTRQADPAPAAPVAAAPATPSPPAQGGMTAGGPFSDSDWGIRFTPPEGWKGQREGGGYVFVSQAQPGFLLVMPLEATSVADLRAGEGLVDEQSGTRLMLEGAPEAFGSNGLAANYTGPVSGQPSKARMVGLVSPHGQGALVMAAVVVDRYTDAYTALAEDLARSVAFFPSQTTPLVREWKEGLEGCRLSYFNRYNSGYGGGGYIDNTTVDLCPGFFNYNDQSETVFNTPDLSGSDMYLYSKKKGAGQWQVTMQGGQPVLQLLFHDGAVQAYTLNFEDGKTFLEGRRWLRTCNPNDQVVEARPQCW